MVRSVSPQNIIISRSTKIHKRESPKGERTGRTSTKNYNNESEKRRNIPVNMMTTTKLKVHNSHICCEGTTFSCHVEWCVMQHLSRTERT